MDTGFRLLPDAASTNAASVDHLTLFVLVISVFFTLLIATLVIFFAIRYRRSASQHQTMQVHGSLSLEVMWTVIPILIVTVMFIAGARVYVRAVQPPGDAMEINVVAKQWMWKIEHPTGAREINELHVPVGTPVKLTLISQDVIHDFAVPAFRIKQDVLPGRYTTEWFQATRPGEYHLFCDQYCGAEHSKMVGMVIVMEPARYRQWLDGTTADDPPRLAGEKLFAQYGCITCHSTRGPSLAGIYGRQVHLQDGQTVVADESYIRDSIFNPSSRVVSGFPSIMPSFKGQLTEEQILDLIQYIKSLAGGTSDAYGLSPSGPATQPNRAIPGPGPFLQAPLPKEQP